MCVCVALPRKVVEKDKKKKKKKITPYTISIYVHKQRVQRDPIELYEIQGRERVKSVRERDAMELVAPIEDIFRKDRYFERERDTELLFMRAIEPTIYSFSLYTFTFKSFFFHTFAERKVFSSAGSELDNFF